MNNVSQEELDKFAQHADDWWDSDGPLKTLHDINPIRLAFIEQQTSLEGKRVLDIGCGGGILAEAMAKKGAIVTAIDIVDEAIATAKAHAKKENLAIDYQTITLDTLTGNDFDIITCMEMLEHVPNPALIIDECQKKLKQTGQLFLSTINRTAKAYLFAIIGAEYLLKLLPKNTHDYKKFIKPSELAACCRKNGLNVKTIKGMDYHPFSRHATLTDDVAVNYLMHCQQQNSH